MKKRNKRSVLYDVFREVEKAKHELNEKLRVLVQQIDLTACDKHDKTGLVESINTTVEHLFKDDLAESINTAVRRASIFQQFDGMDINEACEILALEYPPFMLNGFLRYRFPGMTEYFAFQMWTKMEKRGFCRVESEDRPEVDMQGL